MKQSASSAGGHHPARQSYRGVSTGFVGRRLSSVAVAAVALVGIGPPSPGAAAARLRFPGPVGTVDTVAGPGFCPGPATPAPGSSAVGSLAADGSGAGTVWFESGPVGGGVVTRVLNSASALLGQTGATAPPKAGRPGNPAATSSLASASRLAPDGSGGLLIAKPTAVLQLAEGLTTLAGTMSSPGQKPAGAASAGDGGPIGAARFSRVAAIATDSSGNVYVVDEIEPRTAAVAIRFLNRSGEPVTFYPGTGREITVAPGTIDAIAGSVTGGGQRAPDSRLVAPAPALAVVAGRLYLSSSVPGPRPRAVVRVLNLGGEDLVAHKATVAPATLAQVAEVSGPAGSGAGTGPSGLSPLPGIAADSQGNLFLANQTNNRILRLDAAGSMSTVAGTGAPGFNGNDRPAAGARLDRPYDVEVAPSGRVYIADSGNEQVRFVDQAGMIHAALGNGAAAGWLCDDGDGGPTTPGAPGAPSPPQRGYPVSLAADGTGNAYVVSTQSQVHRLAPSGSLRPIAGRLRVPCGGRVDCPSGDSAPDATTELQDVAAVALRSAGGLYVQDGRGVHFVNLGRRAVRVHGVVVGAGAIATVAGGGRSESPPAVPSPDASALDDDNGKALGAAIRPLVARFGASGALASDRKGNLFIADHANRRIRQVDAEGTISTVLGGAPPDPSAATGASRCCMGPTGVVLDVTGNLYVADIGGRVWFLNRSPAATMVHGVSVAPGGVEAVAGGAGAGSAEDGGRALEAQLPGPWSVAVDRAGNLYVSTLADHTVRRVDIRGAITTVVGNGQAGFNGDGLKGALTALDRPTQVVLDACGNLLVADLGNDRVRRVNLVARCPRAAAGLAPSAPRGAVSPATLAAAGLALVTAAAVATATGRRLARRARRGSLPGSSGALQE